MRVKDIQHIFHTELREIYSRKEVDTIFYRLTESCHGISRLTLALKPEYALNREEEQPLFEALNRLKQHEPIQYILGKASFYGLEFRVNRHVLIPRPETEELVDWILEDLRESGTRGVTIADIGTGSGCIAIALSKNLPGASVIAVDISEEALSVARENAAIHKVPVRFIQKDILQAENLPEPYIDIIVSNPPYVRRLEKGEIKNNVLLHEPYAALFVEDNDPLVFYQKIAGLAITVLPRGGKLFFEINQYLSKEMIEMLRYKGFEAIELKKDINGNDRMIRAVK